MTSSGVSPGRSSVRVTDPSGSIRWSVSKTARSVISLGVRNLEHCSFSQETNGATAFWSSSGGIEPILMTRSPIVCLYAGVANQTIIPSENQLNVTGKETSKPMVTGISTVV